MPPEINKLIASIAELVEKLNEKSGVSDENLDPRYSENREKLAPEEEPTTVEFEEVQENNTVWNKIAKIFAKNYHELNKRPDYDEEPPEGAIPSIIERNVAAQDKKQDSFFESLMKKIMPLIALAGGIVASVIALFEGPGVFGNLLNLLGKGLSKVGMDFLERVGEHIMSYGDDFFKALGTLASEGLKLIGIAPGGTLSKLFGGLAAKVGGFLIKAAKFIPFLGSAVSFYFAYQRFQQGDFVGMGLEIASGILNLIPGYGWIASALIDVINISRDFTTTEEERAAGGMGIVGKVFNGIVDWFKKNGLTIAKNMPFVGSLIYFWEAYQEGFSTPEGIKKIITAFASTMGLGSIIEPAINTLFSFFEENGDTITKIPTTVKSFTSVIKDYVMAQFKKLPGWLKQPLEWLGFGHLVGSENVDVSLPDFKGKSVEIVDKISVLNSNIASWFESGIEKSKQAKDFISDKFKSINASMSEWILNGAEKAKEVGSQMVDKISNLNQAMTNWISDRLTDAKDAGKTIIENISTSSKFATQEVGKSIAETNKYILDTFENIQCVMTPIIADLGNSARKIVDWMKNIFKWAVEKVKSTFSTIFDSLDVFNAEQNNISDTPKDISISGNSVIRVENPYLEHIANNSKAQVNLLQIIADKLDNVSVPVTVPASTPSQQGSPMTGNRGSSIVERGFDSSSLLPVDILGTVA